MTGSSVLAQRITSFLTGARTAWLAIVAALLLSGAAFSLGAAERVAGPTDSLPVGADSTIATEWAEQLPQNDDSTAVVLFQAKTGTLDQAKLGQLRTLAAQLPGSSAKVPLVPSEDKRAAVAIIPVQGSDATAASNAVKAIRDRLASSTPDGVQSGVTGPAAIKADLAAVFEGADFRLLAATAAIVALLLVLTYRSPILWIFPLVVIGIGDRLATVVATHVLDVTGTSWDESTTGILSVLVFGAGTNYALLLISRYRDELRHHDDRREALGLALRRTSHAVLASATTVVFGVLTLLLSAFPTTRGLGLACAVGIVIAVIFALVVLPAVLSSLGRWVFWPRVPQVGETTLDEGHSLWRRVGDSVAKRPMAYVAGTLVALALAAGGLSQVKLGLPDAEQFLETPDSISTAQRLGESFPAGSADPATVLTRADASAVQKAVEQVEGVASVRPGGRSTDGKLTSLQVVLANAPDSDAAEQTVRDIRAAVKPLGQTHVGGSTAKALDEGTGHADDRMKIMPLALVLVLGALMLLLRSLLAPAILVATVIATFLASLGVSWWIFTGLLDFTAVGSNVPLLAFLFLVALGVDYNIFLVTRAREESAAHGSREGMLRALAATGGVITSAGILLAAVFAVLGVLPLVVLAQLGTIICVGVLLDTLVVRTVLVPAIALTLGDRFWWPRKAA
ncbi:MMPL family transporter [Yimella sp. cx-51]|nr:MMPL family transporter [Yimella sp. cx-51]QTH37750.1 MMPL family transporter [Yimella sp. cx-51]